MQSTTASKKVAAWAVTRRAKHGFIANCDRMVARIVGRGHAVFDLKQSLTARRLWRQVLQQVEAEK